MTKIRWYEHSCGGWYPAREDERGSHRAPDQWHHAGCQPAPPAPGQPEPEEEPLEWWGDRDEDWEEETE